MELTAKKVLKYAFLPQVAPRMQGLFGSGFIFIAFLIAQIFASLGLLPRNHPYLNSANTGRFNIRHTIFEAWRHLRFDLRHIDQVLMFFVVLAGLLILILQIAMLVVGVFTMSSAMALDLGADFENMFITANPTNDIAFILLDRVFGIEGLYNSCVATGVACFEGTAYNRQGLIVDPAFPTPFHLAFHQMLEAYSYGMIVVAGVIIMYFVITIIGETAQSGTPFGHRFNHVWAPIRLVVALGLLIPLSSGLNSAQYIVLYAAKFGSGFATNGWHKFLGGSGLPLEAVPADPPDLTSFFDDIFGFGDYIDFMWDMLDQDYSSTGVAGPTVLGDPTTLVGKPQTPAVNNILEFGSSLAACIKTQKFFYNREIKGFIINPDGMSAATSRRGISELAYEDALEFEDYGDIYFVFGEYKEEYTGYAGFVRPYCGEVVLQVTDVAGEYSPGSQAILNAWFNLIAYVLWYDAAMDSGFGDEESAGWDAIIDGDTETRSMGKIGKRASRKLIAGYPGHDPKIEIVEAEDLEQIRDIYINYIEQTMISGVENQKNAPSWNEMGNYGWGGAGIWYNKIAELNGALIAAANSLPVVRKYPEVMEIVQKERKKYDQDITGPERFLPKRADGTEIQLRDPSQYKEAEVAYEAFKVWGSKTARAQPTGNIFADVIHAIFGTKGLYDMAGNSDIHPLAQLVGVGKSLVEASIRNLGAAAAAGLGGGLANIMNLHPAVGNFASVASSIAAKIAMAGLTAGFLLFYVVPFMPFLYFFFAMGTWVKTILEAMVGVPLWALAHLRIDGNGLPGSAAMTGYYLIFDIFIRPICIVFALLASVAIFGAQVKILHGIWPMVTSNMTGFDTNPTVVPDPEKTGGIVWFRGVVDQFMFTIIYTFIVYMMGMASFKLIDLIPDYILRWMGAGAQTFGAIAKDDVAGMPTRAVMGVGAGIQQGMQAAGQLGKATQLATAPSGGGKPQ